MSFGNFLKIAAPIGIGLGLGALTGGFGLAAAPAATGAAGAGTVLGPGAFFGSVAPTAAAGGSAAAGGLSSSLLKGLAGQAVSGLFGGGGSPRATASANGVQAPQASPSLAPRETQGFKTLPDPYASSVRQMYQDYMYGNSGII